MTSTESTWLPTRGDATTALGRYLVDEKKELPDAATFDALVSSSVDIARRCKPFTPEDGSKTGLVIGYVQSGKTMSMTTVASLARDSGCRLVVLLAGVTEILLKQSARQRLKPYLLHKPDQRSGWLLIDTVDSVQLEKNYRSQLQQSVETWRRADVPENRKRPIFITVMKNHRHLSHLVELLSSADLRGIPALILDDEADQAGLDNTAARRSSGIATESSTTHQRILELRKALPNHTYLQYTATAQANLLISLANSLSPDFAYILDPGKGYTGGKTFFMEHEELVRPLAEDEAADGEAAPPDALVKAMSEFFVGVAIGALRSDSGKRSMLIHPSQRMNDHDVFHRHVRKIKDQWEKDLRRPETRDDVLEEFKEAYDDLKQTMSPIPPWSEVASEVPFALGDTQVWKVNSEDGAEVDWDRSYGHVLVGGDKLNRGYTVEGLTVTYMPRTPGGWNADTIQQRARFFGYKARYLGLCRIYLHPEVLQAYRDYVHHEEDVREQLRRHQGHPLQEWQRTFLLDHRMKPTRTSILSEPVERVELDGWFRQRDPHASPQQLPRNRISVEGLRKLCADAGWEKHPEHPEHLVAELALKDFYETFVVDYQCFDGDTTPWLGIALWLAQLLHKTPDARCTIISMGDGKIRKRVLDTRGRIAQLFEGRRPKTGTATYRGDDSFRDPTTVTIQLHRLNVTEKQPTGERDVAADVPAIALHFPDNFKTRDYVTQGSRGVV